MAAPIRANPGPLAGPTQRSQASAAQRAFFEAALNRTQGPVGVTPKVKATPPAKPTATQAVTGTAAQTPTTATQKTVSTDDTAPLPRLGRYLDIRV